MRLDILMDSIGVICGYLRNGWADLDEQGLYL
jgi:hypothetical protein